MKDKIKQLLSSSNLDDVKIGWELLNRKENKPKGKQWYYWWDIITPEPYPGEEREIVVNNCIGEIVGENYTSNKLWINWEPHKTLKDENT